MNLSTSRGDGNPASFYVIDSYFFDMNLSTSRGDGNLISDNIATHGSFLDINLYTSRGDGNCANDETPSFRS